MSRSKYINTFNTTADYDAYIESAYPSFPNVAYDKEADRINIIKTSPNEHLIYGKLIDPTLIPVLNYIRGNVYTYNIEATVSGNYFYIDSLEGTGNLTNFGNLSNGSNISHIYKIKDIDFTHCISFGFFTDWTNLELVDFSGINFGTSVLNNKTMAMFRNCAKLTSIDLSNTNMTITSNNDYYQSFYGCTNLKTLNLNNCTLGNPGNTGSKRPSFTGTTSLTDVYINVEQTLNMLTNSLQSANGYYLPSTATIHYNNGSEIINYTWSGSAWTAQS